MITFAFYEKPGEIIIVLNRHPHPPKVLLCDKPIIKVVIGMGVYEDTLNDIEKTLGAVPSLMKFFPKEKLVHDWPSWKSLGEIDLENVAEFCIQCREATSWRSLGEIDLERARYLLSTDEMVEKMLSETQSNVGLTPIKPSGGAEAAQEESA